MHRARNARLRAPRPSVRRVRPDRDLLTESHGKLTGIAKGAKNSRRRFARDPRAVRPRPSGIPPATHHRPRLSPALRAAGGAPGLHPRPRPLRRRQLRPRADGPHGPRPRDGRGVYRLVRATLGLLDDGALAMDPLLRAFELHLLAASGYGPALDRCRGCDSLHSHRRDVLSRRRTRGLRLPRLRASGRAGAPGGRGRGARVGGADGRARSSVQARATTAPALALTGAADRAAAGARHHRTLALARLHGPHAR